MCFGGDRPVDTIAPSTMLSIGCRYAASPMSMPPMHILNGKNDTPETEDFAFWLLCVYHS